MRRIYSANSVLCHKGAELFRPLTPKQCQSWQSRRSKRTPGCARVRGPACANMDTATTLCGSCPLGQVSRQSAVAEWRGRVGREAEKG